MYTLIIDSQSFLENLSRVICTLHNSSLCTCRTFHILWTGSGIVDKSTRIANETRSQSLKETFSRYIEMESNKNLSVEIGENFSKDTKMVNVARIAVDD
jgi:hypothetical protein